MVTLGCFAAETCQNIGPRQDAAFCANGNYVSRCACCQHHRVFQPQSPLPSLCEPWPPQCALGPPVSTAGGDSIAVHVARAGCDAVNSRRSKGLTLSCDTSLETEAERLLLDALTESPQCSAEGLLGGRIGLPSADVAVLAGQAVLHCTWEESVDAWTSAQDMTPANPQDAQLLLLSAGGLRIGCAQGFRDAADSGLSHCQVRACLVSPVPTTNVVAATTASWPACDDQCRGASEFP
jgi:hypothetical protein